MPIPAWLIAAASAAAGGAQAIWGGKPSSREEELLKRLERRMNEGLDAAEIGRIGQIYAPTISRGLSQRRNQIGRAYASSQGSASSEAISKIGGVPGVGEVMAPIIAKYDLAARESGEEGYMNLSEAMTGRRREAVSSGLGLIGSAAGAYLMGAGGEGEVDETIKTISSGLSLAKETKGNFKGLYYNQGDALREEAAYDLTPAQRARVNRPWKYDDLEDTSLEEGLDLNSLDSAEYLDFDQLQQLLSRRGRKYGNSYEEMPWD